MENKTKADEVSQLQRARADFGEIDFEVDPLGNLRPASAKANPLATGWFYVVDSDRNWYALPCVSQNGYHLYTKPLAILIGRDLITGFGIVPEDGWVDVMKGAEIPDKVVKGVKDFLSSKPPIEWK